MGKVYAMGACEMELEGKYLTCLKESNDIFEDTEGLRERMAEDGYLFFRGFHNKSNSIAARRNILTKLNEMGRLDSRYPMEEGVAAQGKKDFIFGKTNYPVDLPDLLSVVESAETMSFFDRFLGASSLTLDYKWPRAVAPGSGSRAHYDVVYMGRGTKNLYTMWSPLGDVPMELGSLCICLESHRFERLKDTYGKMDISKDMVNSGGFSNNPIEIVELFGGRWATADFQAGDAIIFGMYTMHMSLTNQTGQYRTSCDTRYQLASEPVDQRFMGSNPTPPSYDGVERTITMEELRKQWRL
jgi:hypothetical protein